MVRWLGASVHGWLTDDWLTNWMTECRVHCWVISEVDDRLDVFCMADWCSKWLMDESGCNLDDEGMACC